MIKLKEKMWKIKEDTDAAEEREAAARIEAREAEATAETHQSEAEGIRRRIKLLKNGLDKVCRRVEEQMCALNEVMEKGETHEKARKELEDSEIEGDEKIQELENDVMAARQRKDEATNALIEAKGKLKVLESDLRIAQSREQGSLVKVSRLEETLENLDQRTKDLEEADGHASERELDSEEKVKFLEAQLKEMEKKEEDTKRQIVNLQRHCDRIISEKKHYINLKENVMEEIESLTDMADDI